MSELPQSRAILPEGWPQPRGYANGMVAEGRVLVTGGLVGEADLWTWQVRGGRPVGIRQVRGVGPVQAVDVAVRRPA